MARKTKEQESAAQTESPVVAKRVSKKTADAVIEKAGAAKPVAKPRKRADDNTAPETVVKKSSPKAKKELAIAADASPTPVKRRTSKVVEAAPTESKPRQRKAAATPSSAGSPTDELVTTWRPRQSQTIATEPANPPRETKTKPAPKRKVRTSETEVSDDRLAILEWRSGAPSKPRATTERGRRERRAPEPAVDEQSEVSVATTEDGTESATFRTRKFRDRNQPRTKSAQKAEAPVAKAPPIPELPVREVIPIPEAAPQVVLKNGLPVLIRDRKVLPPLWFFASTLDESQVATVMEEAKMAAENGVHIFSFLVELEVDLASVKTAVSFASYITQKFVEVDPECQVILRTVFVAPAGWEIRHPRGRFISEGGGLAEPSLCDDDFWSEAEACLESFVRTLRSMPNADHLLGIHLERGEWFFAEGWGYDTSVAAHEKFREWLQHRYRNDVVTLRASWFDGSVQFETVPIPEFSGGSGFGDEFVRTGRKSRRWVDYHLFLSDSTTDRISQLAYVVKKASEGYFLTGVSYGYTFEWSHPASGHLALGKLLRSPDLDYIAGPPSYKNREPGGTAAMPSPIDSFALNGKLFMSEEDYKTPISGRQEPDDFNPVMKTPQALESVHWRGAGTAFAHKSGVCWMDTWGNGWLSSAGIWQRAQSIAHSMATRLVSPGTAPDVAVFIDERSLAYLVDERAFGILVQNVRESILRSGLSVGFYLLSDLAHRENFPESKLYVFANAWDIRPEVRSAIKSRLQRDNKVLFWLYAAGLFEGGRESLERVREVTGIALRPQPFNSRPGTTILNSRDPLCQNLPDRQLSQGGQLEPSYFAIPEDASVLGEYSQTGLPSFVVRRFEGEDGPDSRWTSVFLGEPIVTPGLFRALAHMAGAHVWNFSDDVVHVGEPYLTVHCSGTGGRTITLPDKWVAFHLNSNEWAQVEGNSLRFQSLDGATHTFLVGLRSDIEAIMNVNLDDHMTITGDLVRAENTLHWDMVKFDVPIMKLDEWVEETWSDEHADDFLLKPSQLELEPVDEAEESEDPRNRGRRRRRRRDGGREESTYGRRESADRQAASDPDVINVMFRKRD